MTDIQSFHVCIEGQVQGVGFLAWIASKATSLGLSRWVRNCRDGLVEAVFSGDEKSVKLMLEKCRYGPPLATVTNLDDQPCAPPDTSFH